MVVGVVRKEHLTRIPPDLISTVVIYRLERREGEEENGLSDRHERHGMSDCCAKSVEQESFDRMVV
jgi:hypothetical protein